jgi:hypothetical protein
VSDAAKLRSANETIDKLLEALYSADDFVMRVMEWDEADSEEERDELLVKIREALDFAKVEMYGEPDS